MKTVAIFCGSNLGKNPRFVESAREAVQSIISAGFSIVYGGGSVGLMGIVADQAVDSGGVIHGVMPEFLVKKELSRSDLSRFSQVTSLHERKLVIASNADAFLVLPGGPGTMDEFFEQFTWLQLGIHFKPCAILNVEGYYDNIIKHFERMVLEGFLSESHRRALILSADIVQIIHEIKSFQAPGEKWDQKTPAGL